VEVFFFGVFPDGDRILKLLGSSRERITSVYKLKARWNADNFSRSVGMPYEFSITDTVTEIDGEIILKEKGSENVESTGIACEYLVFSDLFVSLASEYGFVPQSNYSLPHVKKLSSNLNQCFDPADQNFFLKHFKPRFIEEKKRGKASLTEQEILDLQDISSVNASFVFFKV